MEASGDFVAPVALQFERNRRDTTMLEHTAVQVWDSVHGVNHAIDYQCGRITLVPVEIIKFRKPIFNQNKNRLLNNHVIRPAISYSR
jgi:hypothetical protein